MCNVYRSFVKDIETISASINTILRKDAPSDYEIRNEKIDALDTFREKTTNPLIMFLPKPSLYTW